MGYIKARQQLNLHANQTRQNLISDKEKSIHQSKQAARLNEVIRRSNTLGAPNMRSNQQKILDLSSQNSNKSQTSNDDDNSKRDRQNDIENALKYTLSDSEGCLTIPQGGLYSLPAGLGDTLYLQTCFLRSISLPRNQIANMFSNDISQLACIHLRYITSLNLSDNKLKSLPPDFGNMSCLQDLNVSINYLSTLPSTFSQLKFLKKLNLKRNNFSDLDFSLASMVNITDLNISSNQFVKLPAPLSRLVYLTSLDISDNLLNHLLIIPAVAGPSHLWQSVLDLKTGNSYFLHMFTCLMICLNY